VRVIADGYPEMIRVTHDGARHERLVWPVATLAGVMLVPGIRGVSTPRLGRQAQVKHIEPQLDPSTFRDQTLRTLPADPHTVDIAEAERIVAGGLGLGTSEGVTELERLADLLNAALGGTRVISDRGWLPVERYIGTTGKIVAPKLYLGFGISGATQHLAGITGSEHIIAVNTDRTSPLLNIADLGIVADLNEVIPVLLEKLAKLKAQRSAAANVTDSVATETSA
jgi:electron transfer flavoprotein alpha subunit